MEDLVIVNFGIVFLQTQSPCMSAFLVRCEILESVRLSGVLVTVLTECRCGIYRLSYRFCIGAALLIICPPPIGQRSIVMTVSVCLSVCLRAYLCNYVSDLRITLLMFPVSAARSCSGSVAICYVLPVLCLLLVRNSQE